MYLQNELLLLFFSFFVSAIIYPILINFLYKAQFRESVREFGPKTHVVKAGTPTMGGIGFFVVTLLINLFFNFSLMQTALVLIIFSIAGVFGLIEDLFKVYSKSKLRENIRIEVYEVFSKTNQSWNLYKILLIPWNLFREFTRIIGSNPTNRGVKLKSHYKFLMHLFLGFLVAYWFYFKLDRSSVILPFFGTFDMGFVYFFIIPLAFVFILNATAITDGLDGLLAGISLIILPVYWVIAVYLGYYGIAKFIAIFFGALLVYLYFNVFPARVFMGDIGSYAIAGVLFIVPLLMRVEFLILITHALCIFDGGISGLAQQLSVKFFKKRIFKMAPVHHHFEVIGWPESKVTMRFYLVQILLSLTSLLVFSFMVF